MKILKEVICASLIFAMAASAQANIMEVKGVLSSLQVSIPGVSDLSATFDPGVPTVVGGLRFGVAGNPDSIYDAYFLESYHNINLQTAAGRSAIASYPSLWLTSLQYAGSEVLFDSSSRTLTVHGAVANVYYRDAFCVGAVELCAGLYSGNTVTAALDMVLTLDSNLSYITSGVANLVHAFGGGATISYQYNLVPASIPEPLPVPAAGWLLGSGLFGLAGGALRRRRLLSMK